MNSRNVHGLGSIYTFGGVFIASFPGPCPASHRFQYGKAGEGLVHFLTRQEAGRGPGNEASVFISPDLLLKTKSTISTKFLLKINFAIIMVT